MSLSPLLPIAYQPVISRIVGEGILRVFKRPDGSLRATHSTIGAVTLKSFFPLREEFLRSSEHSFFSLSGRTVTVHVKGIGGGGKGSKMKVREPQDSAQLSQFLSTANSSSSSPVSSVFSSNVSEAPVIASSLEEDLRKGNHPALANKGKALLRLATDNPPQDPYLVVQHLVNAITSPLAQGLDIVIKTKLAEALHRYVDLTVLKYSVQENKKVLGDGKQEIYAKLDSALSLVEDESSQNKLTHHLAASQAGLYSLKDTTPLVQNSVIAIVKFAAAKDVGAGLALLKQLVDEKRRSDEADWYIGLMVVRSLIEIKGAADTDFILEEVIKALADNKEWKFLFGGVEALAFFVQQGKTRSIRGLAFGALQRFIVFDEFQLKNNWRLRAAALECLIGLFGTEDETLNDQIKAKLIEREAIETDARVRSCFSRLEKTKELQQAWDNLLKEGGYEALIAAEQQKLSSSLAALESKEKEMDASAFFALKAELKKQQSALTERQEALEKSHKELSKKVDALATAQQKTDAVVQDLKQRLDAREAFFDPALPAFFRVPNRNSTFVGRTQLLTTIRDRFSEKTRSTLQVVLAGERGVGAAALATEYLHQRKGDYNLAWWIFGARPYDGIRDLGLALEIGLTPSDPREKVIRAVKEHLQKNEGWLLVFAGVENPEEVQNFLPASGGHVIITTPNLVKNSIPVPPLLSKEATDLFVKLTGVRDVNKAKELAAALLHNPTAIALASAYITYKQSFYFAYLTEFQKIAGTNTPSSLSNVLAPLWKITSQELQNERARSLPLSYRAAFFDPLNIPKNFLVDGPLSSQQTLDVNRSFLLLKSYGVLLAAEQGLAFSISPLLQEAIRNALSEEEKKAILRELFLTLKNEWKFSKNDPSTWKDARFYAPHIAAFCTHAKPFPEFREQIQALTQDLTFVSTT